ncbi:hypothetical protein G7046_g5357 [Stylonectria norvegica]|nr:hypothetical protein G7046_g5357 [Stylonectria norvegica]
MWESLLGPANIDRVQEIVTELPQHCTLDYVSSRLSSSESPQSVLEAAAAAFVCLSRATRLESDGEQLPGLAKQIQETLLAVNPEADQRPSASAAEAGIACLMLLSTTWSHALDDSILLSAIAYNDARDPWTTARAATVASRLIDEQLTADKRADFIIGPVLQSYLRPLFTKSSRVTASGRPSQYPTSIGQPQPVAQIPLWKTQDPWAVTILRWAVRASESSLIENHWPLFIPVLISLVEDEDPRIKSEGLQTLALFIRKCPAKVLQTTGISLMFEEVTFPALLHLPSITPEQEAETLLVPAYRVLIKLAEAHQSSKNPDRRRLLDKVLRDGIITGYHHASQHPRIVQILMESMALVNLLPIVSSVMTDPFGLACLPVIRAAAQALNAIVVNCWPRLVEPRHSENVIRIAALCWLNLNGGLPAAQSPDDMKAIGEELFQTSKMLRLMWAQYNIPPPPRLAEVLDQEPRLANLFSVALPPKTRVS